MVLRRGRRESPTAWVSSESGRIVPRCRCSGSGTTKASWIEGDYGPAVMVYVTVREVEASVPAASVADSEYVRSRPDSASVEIPVTRSAAAVLSGFGPVLSPPALGASSCALSVKPAGMFWLMLAETFWFVWLVVTAQLTVTLAGVSGLPAVAVETVSV